MTDDPSILATLPDASQKSIERCWRLALQQELGLIVDVSADLKLESVQVRFYDCRKAMLEADPTLPLLDFYITLPLERHAIVVVREPKATLE